MKEQKEVDKVLPKKYIVLVRNKQQHRGRRERMDIGMRTRRITSEDTREKLAKLILDYAKENKLTESNIKEALQDVKRWMRNNAIIT